MPSEQEIATFREQGPSTLLKDDGTVARMPALGASPTTADAEGSVQRKTPSRCLFQCTYFSSKIAPFNNISA